MKDEQGLGDSIYKEHLDFSELLIGIKEGRFFQGRLNVSRLSIEEATVNVQGLRQEILISDIKSQNRALNGDIVAIEILPKKKWLKNYK
jgi:exosome complex exonuclease DIS3/RRP44